MIIQPIGTDLSQPYRFQHYLRTKKKKVVEAKQSVQLKTDTVEISQEGMELYLKERFRSETH